MTTTTQFKPWSPKRQYALHDREFWAVRFQNGKPHRTKVSCDACGYDAHHYSATFVDCGSAGYVFAVPYAGLNGGTGHELDADEWAADLTDDMEVWLSKCCDYPRRQPRRTTR